MLKRILSKNLFKSISHRLTTPNYFKFSSYEFKSTSTMRYSRFASYLNYIFNNNIFQKKYDNAVKLYQFGNFKEAAKIFDSIYTNYFHLLSSNQDKFELVLLTCDSLLRCSNISKGSEYYNLLKSLASKSDSDSLNILRFHSLSSFKHLLNLDLPALQSSIDQGLKLVENLHYGEFEIIASLYNHKSILEFSLGNIDSAKKCIEKFCEIVENNIDMQFSCYGLILKARLSINSGNVEEGIKSLKLIIDYWTSSDRINDDPDSGLLYIELATAYLKTSNDKSAFECIEKGMNLLNSSRDDSNFRLIIANKMLGDALIEVESYEDAIKFLLNAKMVAIKLFTNPERHTLWLNNSILKCLKALEKHEETITISKNFLELSKKYPSIPLTPHAKIHKDLGEVYNALEKPDEAIQHSNEALKLLEKDEYDPFKYAEIFSNIAEAYSQKKDWKQKLFYVEKTLNIAQSNKFDKSYLADIHREIGKTYLEMEMHEKVIESLNIALDYYKSLKTDSDKRSILVEIYETMSMSLMMLGQIAERNKVLELAFSICNENHEMKERKIQLLEKISFGYVMMGNYDEAIKRFEELKTLVESVSEGDDPRIDISAGMIQELKKNRKMTSVN